MLEVQAAAAERLPADLVAIGFPVCGENGRLLPVPALPSSQVAALGFRGPGERGLADEASWRRRGFSAKVGQTLVASVADGRPPLYLVGLGDRDRIDAERWRRAAAAFVHAAGNGGTAALLLPTPGEVGEAKAEQGHRAAGHEGAGPAVAAAVTEAAILAAYQYEEFRSPEATRGAQALGRLLVVGGSQSVAEIKGAVRRGTVAAQAACWARDLVNRPSSALTPRALAAAVSERFADCEGVSVEVWDERRIAQERLGGLLGVSRGSSEPPRFLVLRFAPADTEPAGRAGQARTGRSNGRSGPDARVRRPRITLVGKGITFDSGGLSLKSADAMTTMKTDMSGAAAVCAASWACATEGLAVELAAMVPVSENMPGSSATKPGDVLTVRNGTTIEVLNTDAEGRLVLADALCLATEERPDAIVDVATLSGAAVVALGPSIAALYGNPGSLVDDVRTAGDRAGERLWPMPLADEYREHLESDVADVKNVGRAGQAGSIVAALLLQRFVGDVPWVHIDIAGPARAAEASGYLTKGGTGFGTRTLLELLRARSHRAAEHHRERRAAVSRGARS